MTEFYPVSKEYERRRRKIEYAATGISAIPLAGLIGLGIHGLKKGWLTKNPSILVGAALAAAPATKIFTDLGNKLVDDRRRRLEDAYKATAIGLASKYNASVSIPSGSVKVV